MLRELGQPIYRIESVICFLRLREYLKHYCLTCMLAAVNN